MHKQTRLHDTLILLIVVRVVTLFWWVVSGPGRPVVSLGAFISSIRCFLADVLQWGRAPSASVQTKLVQQSDYVHQLEFAHETD